MLLKKHYFASLSKTLVCWLKQNIILANNELCCHILKYRNYKLVTQPETNQHD